MKKREKKKNKQVEQTLNLLRDHLMDIIDHPEKLERIPEQATVVLVPVPMRKKAA